VTEVPEHVRALARQRDQARGRGDFERADALRDEIRSAGFDVTDTPGGTTVAGVHDAEERVFDRSQDVPSRLDAPPTFEVSVHWLADRWREDVVRGVDSFLRHAGTRSIQHVVVEAPSNAEEGWHAGVERVRVSPDLGWAAARNAGLRRSAGAVVVIADGSVEAEGDALGPLVDALEDPTIGITGPFGLVTEDLREFRESNGPDVDAIEAYLLAVRRDVLLLGVRLDERFAFYRNADLELSFQVKALGLRAVVTPVPVRRHAHRAWEATPEEQRSRLSKRNFNRFLDRWRSRADLLVANRRAR
jgi:hypothetical protein